MTIHVESDMALMCFSSTYCHLTSLSLSPPSDVLPKLSQLKACISAGVGGGRLPRGRQYGCAEKHSPSVKTPQMGL